MVLPRRDSHPARSCLEKSSLFLVWFFLTLIVIIIILILLRNKIRLLIFRIKSNFKKKPAEPQRYVLPPPTAKLPPQNLRPPMNAAFRPIQRQIPKGSDKDFEETLKKLKEMSK